MSAIQPVNVAHVTQALLEQLRDHPDLQDVRVERSAEVPNGENDAGWVGIYRAGVQYPSRALGRGAGYRRQLIRLVVMVQQSDYTSGEECEDRLEALAQKVLGAVLSDESLKGTVETLDEVDVTYPSYSKAEGGPFVQTAQINLIGVVNVSAM